MKKALAGTLLATVGLLVGVRGITVAQAGEKLSGTAYIAGHGGHLAVIDLATLREPTDSDKDRVVIADAGGKLEGTTAGMTLDKAHPKPGGGSHGSALVGKTLVVGLPNGKVVNYDIATGKKSAPLDVGKKFCDDVVGPDGLLDMEDMAGGHVYVWDAKGLKLVDKMPVGAAV
ncbi:MAG TPA: hypothetical protein VN317_03550 [Candidatus Methanoperedens sp.]|nr:hypothetical protein [Candidatus Methanoperedens sp.]